MLTFGTLPLLKITWGVKKWGNLRFFMKNNRICSKFAIAAAKNHDDRYLKVPFPVCSVCEMNRQCYSLSTNHYINILYLMVFFNEWIFSKITMCAVHYGGKSVQTRLF